MFPGILIVSGAPPRSAEALGSGLCHACPTSVDRMRARRPPRFRPSLSLAAALLATLIVGGAGGGAAPQGGGTAPTPPRSEGVGSTAGSSPSPLVAAADSLVFANRYADADHAYTGAVAAEPQNPLAHAAYALFLTYRLEFDAALREARAATAAGPASGRAWAVLCRAEDWSSHIEDAVTAGRKAVALAPADPLAHLFLAEALADRGDAGGSRVEISTAGGLLGADSPVYLRAELRREEGNLARDQGNVGAELVSFQAADRIQPDWVERPAELAGAYVDNGNLDGAHTAVVRALGLAPADPGLLASLGQVCIDQADYAGAEQAYSALLAIQPGSAPVLELNALVAMALHHDANRARGLLEQAITADPTDVRAAAFLLNLERDVGGDEKRGYTEIAMATLASVTNPDGPGRSRSGPRPPDPDAVQRAHAAAALSAVNAARARAGLAAVRLDQRLSDSGLAHTWYWFFNNASPSVAKLGIHLETPGLPGFAGARAGDRAGVFGWHDGPIGEDITHRGDATAAVGDWVDSVYHRFPIMRPDLKVIGYADAGIGNLPMEDMEFGFGFPSGPAHAPVAYPADGQAQVPTTFFDNELPDPVPAGAPRTTGYPVTVTFDQYSSARVSSLSLSGPNGVELPAYILSPGVSTENSASLLPQRPLAPHTVYTVKLTATVDGSAYDRTWRFTTAG